MEATRKLLPIKDIKRVYVGLIGLEKFKEGTPEMADAVLAYFQMEDDVIEKYVVPDGVELTEENYGEFRKELRERVMNVMQGNKFRRNSESIG